MGKKQKIQEIAEEFEQEGPKATLKELHKEYGLDQKELGKIILISSLATFVIAASSALALQDTYKQVEQANQDLDRVEGIITSDNLQNAVEQLQGRLGGRLSSSMNVISSDLDKVNSSISSLESTERDIERKVQTYQWVSLISLIGIISGFVTMYV